MTSLAKFQEHQRDNPKWQSGVHFDRANPDSPPVRGAMGLLRNQEIEDHTVPVNDGHVDVFDLHKPEDKEKLSKIIDAEANGLFQIYRLREEFVLQPSGEVHVIVYCVWIEMYRELTGPAATAVRQQQQQKM